MTLLEIIRKKKLATATVATPATDKPVLVPSVAKVASVAVAKQKTNKAALPEDAESEERRKKVLKMLEDRPEIQRAFVTDTETDSKYVIVTIAIRGQYSFDMQIPKDRYDPFLLLEIIERGGVQ
ncbi:hypothetical protein [Nitrosomonas oligotropha]|uniref:hypothetical protein n=1 Tax=Nitrosomonas oligotropha TaxID=42354 RepID=UPI00136EE867|nr:hypothetical protein [Nitrosomonas oligotropha]MXS83691.1 hypothetical protein [Nitrosomonas oligotropha]